MNDVPKQRRNSISAPEEQRTVTIDMAKNAAKHTSATSVTVTAENVRGFTQASANQHPTVYLQDKSGDPMGRITQEHNKRENVGAHPQHGIEWYFQNVSRNLIAKSMARKNGMSSQEKLIDAASTSISNPELNTGKKQLVEVFLNDKLDVMATHKSRSEFQDLSGPGTREAREKLIKRLETGPLGPKSLSKMPGGSKDDWDVL